MAQNSISISSYSLNRHPERPDASLTLMTTDGSPIVIDSLVSQSILIHYQAVGSNRIQFDFKPRNNNGKSDAKTERKISFVYIHLFSTVMLHDIQAILFYVSSLLFSSCFCFSLFLFLFLFFIILYKIYRY